MTLERLRVHLILSWLGTWIACTGLIFTASAMKSKGITLDYAIPLFQDLSAAVTPALGVMVLSFFVTKTAAVTVTSGQQIVALTLSYVYLAGVLILTSALVFLRGVPVDTNLLLKLAPLSPLVMAPLSYIFGHHSKTKLKF